MEIETMCAEWSQHDAVYLKRCCANRKTMWMKQRKWESFTPFFTFMQLQNRVPEILTSNNIDNSHCRIAVKNKSETVGHNLSQLRRNYVSIAILSARILFKKKCFSPDCHVTRWNGKSCWHHRSKSFADDLHFYVNETWETFCCCLQLDE